MNATLPPPNNPFSNQPVTWCSKCGMPLMSHEKSLRVKDDTAIDFDERTLYSFIFYFCPNCKEEMKKWYEGGIRGAVERKKEIMKRLEAEDLKNR